MNRYSVIMPFAKLATVVVALVSLNSSSKPLNVSHVKSQTLSCDTVVANERYTVMTLQRIRRTVVKQMYNAVHQRLQIMKIASFCDVILPSSFRMETVALYNTEQQSQMTVCLTYPFFCDLGFRH